MSSGCGDVLSLADLQTAKKHQIFEAEVITGKSGGVAGGADIDYATNPVTGQVQKTLPAVLRDAGISPVSWDFSTGGTLTVNDRDKVVYDPVSKTWYSYAGALPVTVPSGFNPVGNADWKPQTDPDLRNDLSAGGGATLVGYTDPLSGATSNVSNVLDGKLPNIIGSIDTPIDGFKFSSFKTYHGDHDYQFILSGTEIQTTKRFKKTGNATVTLVPAIGSTSNPLTVDTVAYVDAVAPSYETFPQGTIIKNTTFEADDSGGEVGLTINAGQGFVLEKVAAKNAKTAILLNEVWLTTLTNIATWGQIRQNGGTSTTYTNVWCATKDSTVEQGSFRISGTTYSNLIGCAVDGGVATAYFFDRCSNVNVIGCGAELCHGRTLDYGSAMAFISENTITVDGFRYVPISSDPGPIISVNGQQNRITIRNFRVGGTYSSDILIHGPGNSIVFDSCLFEGGELPHVEFGPGSIGSRVSVTTPSGNRYTAVSTGAASAATFEPFLAEGDLPNAAITFGVTSTGVTGAVKDIKYRKQGGMLTVEFDITLNGFSGQSGAMQIKGMPYAAKNYGSGVVTLATGLQTGVGSVSVTIVRGATALEFYNHQIPATATLQSSSISSTSRIRGSISYEIATNFL